MLSKLLSPYAILPLVIIALAGIAFAIKSPSEDLGIRNNRVNWTEVERITPSDPCGEDRPAMISKEIAEFLKLYKPIEKPIESMTEEELFSRKPDSPSYRHSPEYLKASEAREKRLQPERDRVEAILEQYYDHLMKRTVYLSSEGYLVGYGDINGWRVDTLETKGGRPTDKHYIRVSLDPDYGIYLYIDNPNSAGLPLPECLQGVPVHFVKEKLA